jgi:hypothetical protein
MKIVTWPWISSSKKSQNSSEIYMKSVVICIYRMMPMAIGCGGFLPNLGATEIGR